MPTRGTMFPDIAVSAYQRQTEVLMTRIEVPWGDPQVNMPHPFCVEHISWNSEFFTPAEIAQVAQWHRDNAHTYFSLYDNMGFGSLAIPKQQFATVVAGQMAYTLPAKELTGVTLYDNVATVISATRYTLTSGAGTEGETVVTFLAGQLPVTGHTLSYVAASGRQKFTVWCKTPKFPRHHSGEGDLFTLESPLEFVSRLVQP